MHRPNPIILQRQPVFSLEQLGRIEDAALRILETVGIAVLDDTVLGRLQAGGFGVKDGNRIMIRRELVEEFLDAGRQRNGNEFSDRPREVAPESDEIQVSVSPYPQRVHDLETGRIVPFDTERLIEATRLLDVLELTAPPGCPTDVPPALQPIVQYWVAATNCRQHHPVDPKSHESLPYVMEMADVLGSPMQGLPIYVFTPLTLGSESLACVLKFKDRLSSVWVSDMASLGCATPVSVGDAYALCVAEVVGSAILLAEIIDLPIRWSTRLCPIDLRSMAMVLGSPEDFLLQFANSEVNAYFHGTAWSPAVSGIHTNAKLPDAQACAEKASLMTTGALLGARQFGSAGTLSLDEVFSAEQLLYDLEIRDHVQRLVRGLDGRCDPEECPREVAEGVRQKGFAGLESTLRNYRQTYWHPDLFNRELSAAWEAAGARPLRENAHARIRELLGKHDYELDPARRRELDKIVARAKAQLLG